ncbi:hypothetical protein H1R20_g10002, partial [Candolleomyces eurysporus]
MSSTTFPAELWQLIFRAATSTPGSLTPPLESFHYHYFAADPGERRARRALETGWRLAKVCKEWRNIMRPLLFEHVVLKDFAALDSLTKSVDKSVFDDAVLQGELVQRLDIVARNDRGSDPEGIRDLFSEISHLLTLLPQLKVVLFHNSFRVDGNWLSGTGPFFLNSASKTLESIAWIDDDKDWTLMKVPFSLWASFLNSHPNLKSIHPPHVKAEEELVWQIRDGEAQTPLSKPLAKVAQVVLRIFHGSHTDPMFFPGPTHDRDPNVSSDSNGSFKEDMFPKLRHVTFEFCILGPMAMEMLDGVVPIPTLLELHGHKLTSLHCVFHKTADEDFLEYNDVPPQTQFFPMIARHCVNLEELGLYFNWKSVPSTYIGNTTLPTVKRLKIRRMNRHFRLEPYKIMLNFVAETAILRLPRLEEVVFVCERDVRYIRSSKIEIGEDIVMAKEEKELTEIKHGSRGKQSPDVVEAYPAKRIKSENLPALRKPARLSPPVKKVELETSGAKVENMAAELESSHSKAKLESAQTTITQTTPGPSSTQKLTAVTVVSRTKIPSDKIKSVALFFPKAVLEDHLTGTSTLTISPQPLALKMHLPFLSTEYRAATQALLWTNDPSLSAGKKKPTPSTIRRFLYPNFETNPDMPAAPGEPGLLLCGRTEPVFDAKPWSLFIRVIDDSSTLKRWTYGGEYMCTLVGHLSASAFKAQPLVVKQTWGGEDCFS